MANRDGHFKVLEQIGYNAHKLELSGDMNETTSFNMGEHAPILSIYYIIYTHFHLVFWLV